MCLLSSASCQGWALINHLLFLLGINQSPLCPSVSFATTSFPSALPSVKHIWRDSEWFQMVICHRSIWQCGWRKNKVVGKWLANEPERHRGNLLCLGLYYCISNSWEFGHLQLLAGLEFWPLLSGVAFFRNKVGWLLILQCECDAKNSEKQ